MKRLLKRSKKIFGSNAEIAALLMVTPAQKLVSVRREISMPSRVWMRMRSFETVTMCVVPTAPIVSGGMVVELRNSALNVLAGPGEGPFPVGGVARVPTLAPTEFWPVIGTPFRRSGGG